MPRTVPRDDIPFVLAGWGLTLVYLVLIAVGFKQFSIWQQILDLQLQDPIQLLRSLHPHALRLTVVLPYLFLAQKTGLPADWLFSLAIGVSMVATSIMASAMLSAVAFGNGRYRFGAYLLVAVPIFTLSLVMNGRIAFAMAGVTLIAFQQTFWFERFKSSRSIHPAWQVLGLWLASVSSGTLAVAFLLVILGNTGASLSRFPMLARRNVPSLVAAAIGGLLVLPVVAVGFAKNVRFFGGGIQGFFAMLHHGAGKVLPPDPLLFALSAIAFVAGGLVVAREVFRLVQSPSGRGPLYLTVLLGIAGGSFGFSTLACAAPAYLVAFFVWLLAPARSANAAPA